MSGFTDSIVGGIGTLIRQYIRSPNYVPGASGWSINQDGSVEFNNGTFRGTIVIDNAGLALLVYDGAPAAGNLILAISAAAGSDSFGNPYNAGLTIENDPSYPGEPGEILTFNTIAEGSLLFGASIGMTNFVPGEPFFLALNGPSSSGSESIQVGFDLNGKPAMTFGKGTMGGAYSEEVTSGGQIIPNASTTVVLAPLFELAPANLYSDYGSQWDLATGTWTCPVSSFYDCSSRIAFSSWASGRLAYYLFNNTQGNNAAISDLDPTASGQTAMSGTFWANAGETFNVHVYQASGAARTVNFNRIFIGRRLT